MAGRSTTAAVNIATTAQRLPPTAVASKLPTLLAIAAMVVGATTVGIFLGSELGAFDTEAAQVQETGPPSAAAPAYGAGDTLTRADSMTDVRAQAQRLVDAYRANMGLAAADQAAAAALIREAEGAQTREAAAVFLKLALQLKPGDATATRLMEALGTVATLDSSDRSEALGGDFLLDDSSRRVNLAFDSARAGRGSSFTDETSVGGDDSVAGLNPQPNDIDGVTTVLADSAGTAFEGGTEGGPTAVGAEVESGGVVATSGGDTPTATIGTPPTPLGVPTAASDVQ